MSPVWASDSSDDDLPALKDILTRNRGQAQSFSNANPRRKHRDASKAVTDLDDGEDAPAPAPSKESAVRRRKLGQAVDNPLLRPWGQNTDDYTNVNGDRIAGLKLNESEKSTRLRVELRDRKPRAVAAITKLEESRDEEETVVEDITIIDDSVYFSFSDPDSEDEFVLQDSDPAEILRSKSNPARTKERKNPPLKNLSRTKLEDSEVTQFSRRAPSTGESNQSSESGARDVSQGSKITDKTIIINRGETSDFITHNRKHSQRTVKDQVGSFTTDDDLVGTLSKLRLEPGNAPTWQSNKGQRTGASQDDVSEKPSTPPNTPPKTRPKGLISPTKKLPRIPMTPHEPTSDTFWNQEFNDGWNEKHSPRKLFQPKPVASPVKKITTKKEQIVQREAKKSFECSKHEIAGNFLRELDQVITEGRLTKLAESTGGIKLQWTKTLNTTAGRANWRRETIRRKHSCVAAGNGGAAETVMTTEHRHHATIELADKVIDNENRLLNVLTHEFCHLATFMITGVTTNPHGREFKSWAAKCTRAFGDRGINVTTKHNYEIDFKFIWECIECAGEYKRHSRSINPTRHRCGICKGQLRQTKPMPRGTAASAKPGDTKKKEPTEYQVFMKEQMKIIREENPGSPQKEVMKQVAERWSKAKPKAKGVAKSGSLDDLDKATKGLVDLTLGE